MCPCSRNVSGDCKCPNLLYDSDLTCSLVAETRVVTAICKCPSLLYGSDIICALAAITGAITVNAPIYCRQ
jgi:hypothetical protein